MVYLNVPLSTKMENELMKLERELVLPTKISLIVCVKPTKSLRIGNVKLKMKPKMQEFRQ